MDPMDIDSIVYVPDTPDRLAVRDTKVNSSIDVPDSPDRSVDGDKFKNSNDKGIIRIRANENGSRKLFMGPPKRHHGSSSATASGNSFSKSSLAFKRHDPSYGSSHNQSAISEKMQSGMSYIPHEGSVQDLTEQHCHGNKGKKVVSSGGSQIVENGKRLLSDKGKKVVSAEGSQNVENGKKLLSSVQLHSHQSVADSRLVSRINNVKRNNNTSSAFDLDKGVESNAVTPPKVGQFVSASPASFSSSRSNGQKRLVRNGCIAPCNVAKAQKDFGKDKNGTSRTTEDGPSHVSSSRSQADALASVISKGKGICPLSNEEPGGQNAIGRDNVSINEILEEDDDSNGWPFNGGWRKTHNRSKKMLPSSSEEHQLLPVDHSSSLSGNESPLPLRQRLHLLKSRSNQHNGDHSVTDVIRKRQKQGSSSSIQDDSGDTIESRTTRSRRLNHVDTVARVIETGDANSGVRSNGSNGASSSSSVDADMARQMEADEMLARELQEQLYNEELGVRFGEVDVHERSDLQHENVQHALPRRNRLASTARPVSTANPSRPPRVRPNTNVTRNGYETRASIQSRMNRLRNRFPGRPRTVSSSSSSSSREGSSLFPAEMDVELRMSILEALEAFNDMGVDNNFLEIHREFNENDYEMLLGLDENNHRHSGASTTRINDLPQTTLENDNLEEACAICLETPTTGDTIRHLPCFHRFHKDCIDPWLSRKSSCPVCKYSIT